MLLFKDVPSNRQTREESLKLVEKFAGSNHEIIDAKKELMEVLDEKYER